MIQTSAGEDQEKSDEIANKLISILVLDCYNTIKEDRAIAVNYKFIFIDFSLINKIRIE
jgi:hypothetical protein